MQVTYEAVAALTLQRGDERVSLSRGARLRLDLEHHDFNEAQLRRAIDAGKLRMLPLGARTDESPMHHG